MDKIWMAPQGDHCYIYRPVGWDFDVIEVRTKDGKCIGMMVRR